MLTITEALAEIKTISKKIEKKEQFVFDYLMRQEQLKDPLEKDGGSFAAVASTRQSIRDLQERMVSLRSAINSVNQHEKLTIDGEARSIADWIVWRREVAPMVGKFLGSLRGKIAAIRQQATTKGLQVVQEGEAKSQADVIINVNEKALAEDIEHLETVLGDLDGQLSLKNATTFIEV